MNAAAPILEAFWIFIPGLDPSAFSALRIKSKFMPPELSVVTEMLFSLIEVKLIPARLRSSELDPNFCD